MKITKESKERIDRRGNVTTDALQTELNASDVFTVTSTIGDCTATFNDSGVFQVATGNMASGDSQECHLVNNIVIVGGTVPTTPVT